MSHNETFSLASEMVDALRNRYTPVPVPPCRVCGKPLQVAAVGGGNAPTYACGNVKREDGTTDLEHYERSQHKHLYSGDEDVIALLDALSVAETLLYDIGQIPKSNLSSDIWGRLYAITNPGTK